LTDVAEETAREQIDPSAEPRSFPTDQREWRDGDERVAFPERPQFEAACPRRGDATMVIRLS
jgi:hypothetical protein